MIGGGGDSGGGVGDGASSTVGTSSTVMPSCSEAATAEERLVESKDCNATAVVEAGTAMLAVIRTEAAVMLIVTADVSTDATVAMVCCKLEVFE